MSIGSSFLKIALTVLILSLVTTGVITALFTDKSYKELMAGLVADDIEKSMKDFEAEANAKFNEALEFEKNKAKALEEKLRNKVSDLF